MRKQISSSTRRSILKIGAIGAAPFGLASKLFAFEALELTPEAPDADEPTPEQTEGPYFKPKSPERKSLRQKATEGTVLMVGGRVLGTNGKPIAKALLDFWHCDAQGVYDNNGFKLRGHQFTDTEGKFQLETIVPGVYPGRTRHIHVKVQAPNASVLTTQLYFPDEPQNARDGIFDRRLVMKVAPDKDGRKGAFDFVVRR
ncbi:MAG: intradiol ring-cleavage dioxygenase [Armatimonadetes bacterium]|nr:intradiol ring-cleavage dioxygenase [Armatimonadota bacterium]